MAEEKSNTVTETNANPSVATAGVVDLTSIENNFDIFNLFIDKNVKFWKEHYRIDPKTKTKKTTAPADWMITLHLPTVRDLYSKDEVGFFIQLFGTSLKTFKPLRKLAGQEINTPLQFMKFVFFSPFAQYSEIRAHTRKIKKSFNFFLPDLKIDRQKKEFLLRNILKEETNKENSFVTMTEEICEQIGYLLKLSCGEKASKPVAFSSEASYKFYLAQKEMDDQIASIRARNGSTKNKDVLMKTFLSIEYEFPSYTHEYLLDQTMAQIQWLQKYAAGAVSYKINAQAFAAGNMKKGSKLTFFIN